MKVDWSIAPEWAKYAAMNYQGEWYWFEEEPTYDMKSGFWVYDFYGVRGRNEKFQASKHCESSLSKRPSQNIKSSNKVPWFEIETTQDNYYQCGEL